MKKISLVVVLFAAVLFAGCGDKVQELKDTKDGVVSKVEEGKSLAGGLKDAMKNGVAMKCVTETTGADGAWTVYTNGVNMRAEGITEGVAQNVLKKGDVTYSWVKGTKTGQMIDMKCIEGIKKRMGMQGSDDMFEDDDDFSFDDLKKSEEEGKTKCSPSTEGDFSVPKDVNFIDQCKVMEKQTAGFAEQMEQMQKAQQK